MDKPKQFKPKKSSGKTFKKKCNKESARSRGYDAEWQRYRFRFLHHNPTCYVCGQNKATIVDHLHAARFDKENLFWNEMNYAQMCNSCHSTVTALFDRHATPMVKEKLEWMSRKRSQNRVTIKIKVVPFKLGSGLNR